MDLIISSVNSVKMLHYVAPRTPTGFTIIEEHFTVGDITLTFQWDPPQGVGPEVIVDYYWISIFPPPVSHSMINNVTSSPWNVTVDYNTIYFVNITAVNCAGQSGTFELPHYEYGMHKLACTLLMTECLARF